LSKGLKNTIISAGNNKLGWPLISNAITTKLAATLQQQQKFSRRNSKQTHN
jgi:hypothetical protein